MSNFDSSRATRQRGQGIAFDDTLNNPEDTIALRFERQVAAIPDELALTTDENSLTYRALDLEASRVAAVLTSLPCPHNQPIVLFIKDEATRIRVMTVWPPALIWPPAFTSQSRSRDWSVSLNRRSIHFLLSSRGAMSLIGCQSSVLILAWI